MQGNKSNLIFVGFFEFFQVEECMRFPARVKLRAVSRLECAENGRRRLKVLCFSDQSFIGF